MRRVDHDAHRLGSTHVYWREAPDRVVITHRGRWRLLLLVAYLVLGGALFLPELDAALFKGWLFVLASLSVVFFGFFRGPGVVEVSQGLITLQYLGGLVRRTIGHHAHFEVQRAHVAGRTPHTHIRLASCHPDRAPLILIHIHGLDADEAPLTPLLTAMTRHIEARNQPTDRITHAGLDTTAAPRDKHQP